MSKTKKLVGFFIACGVVAIIFYSISELRKYQSANNEWKQTIKSLLNIFKTDCILEKELDKNNLTDEDQLLISECVDKKIKKMKESFKTSNND